MTRNQIDCKERKMLILKKTTLIQISILTTTLFLNTGCFEFFDEPSPQVVVTKKQQVKKRVVSAPVSRQRAVTPVLTPIPVECTDDINSPSGCQKKPISSKELKPKKVTMEGGEVHKLRSIQGKKITIVERKNGFYFPQYKNKIVVLQMFGKNCSHCIKEMPVLHKIYNKYRKHIEIIAVQVEDKMGPREARRLIQKHHIKYPIIPGDDATNLQYNVQSTYGWTGILPYTLVVQNGITEFTYPGEVSYNEINSNIRSLLP